MAFSTKTLLTTALAVGSLFPFVTGNCAHGTTLFPRGVAIRSTAYNYDDMTGPLNWFGLDHTAYKVCATGRYQSPIHLDSTFHPTLASDASVNAVLHLPSEPEGVNITNNGHTLEAEAERGILAIGAPKKRYSLKQYHFHTPSEHRIHDLHYPLEIHMVFQADDEDIAVVGFPIEVGTTPTQVLEETFKNVHDLKSVDSVAKTGPLDFTEVRKQFNTKPLYHYSGSLTTPPCNEGVSWFVPAEPLYVSVPTYHKVKRVMKFNSRYTQSAPGLENLLELAYNDFGGT